MKTYGYKCYRQKREVSKKYLKAHGLDTSKICNSKSIPFWHIDLMALSVFRAVWGEQKEAVLLAYQMIEECAAEECKSNCSLVDTLKAQMEKLIIAIIRIGGIQLGEELFQLPKPQKRRKP